MRRSIHEGFGTRAQLLASQILGQVMPIATIPLLTRLLDPVEMGHYQIALSIALIALPFAIFQTDVFVPVAHNEFEVTTLVRRALLSTSIFALFAATISFFISSGGGLELAASTFLLTAAMSLNSVANSILIRKSDIPKLIQRNIFGGAFVAITQAVFTILHPSAISLGLGMVVGRAISQILLKSTKSCEPHPNHVEVSKGFLRALIGSGANALGTFASQMPMLLVAPLYGAASAGYLGLSQRVVGAPTGLIGQGINQIIVADASAIIRSGNGKLWAGLRRQIVLLLSFSVAAAVALAIIAPPLTPWVFGALWAPAGEYIQILALPMCLQLVAVPMVPLMAMLGMQRELFCLQVLRIVCITVCVLAGATFSLGMSSTVTLISVVWTMAYCATIALAIVAIRKYDLQALRARNGQ
ncbi:oligosaccharide flippase family protein [Caulobacter segnis]|uniref:lipopolysaccharide biosynthesis protein n=1 Tax=Caulobacter segnis TaxID=88688 RepID=UPI00240F4B66|nr:oligosaccharide flippase family protein [Caulobacter segnis]MDG2520499.1 oligosaccharide flippase family protein [Caulobacter segnis]